jgi:hypothetical protein
VNMTSTTHISSGKSRLYCSLKSRMIDLKTTVNAKTQMTHRPQQRRNPLINRPVLNIYQKEITKPNAGNTFDMISMNSSIPDKLQSSVTISSCEGINFRKKIVPKIYHNLHSIFSSFLSEIVPETQKEPDIGYGVPTR